MKTSNLIFILAFFMLLMMTSIQAQNGFCPGNIFQNGDLENGNPTTSHQDINNAVGYSSIWGPGSLADYYDAVNSPFLPPVPASGNWAGFWVSNQNTTDITYREGLFNTLNTTITQNSGIYSFTFDMACLGGWGQAELGIYGIDNPSGNISSLSPVTNHVPANEAFFGAANTMKFGDVPITTCTGTKSNYTITFDTADPAFPIGGVTHILLTHSEDTIQGVRYIALDNFCMVYEGPSPIGDCASIINENTICNPDGSVTYSFDFIYNGTLQVDNFVVTDLSGNPLFNAGGLNLVNGSVYSTVSFTIPAGTSVFCFRLRLFGEEECCHIEHCIDVPICNPCDSVWVESFPLDDGGDCCHSIDVINNYNGNYFTNITTTIITPGVTFSNPVANGAWTVTGTNTSLKWTPGSGPSYIPLGVSTGVMDFCLDNIIQNTQIPQTIVFDWWAMDPSGVLDIVCSDTLTFDCSGCLFVSDDMIDCLPDGTYDYNFTIWNNTNPAHDATDLRIVPLMSGVCLDGNGSNVPVMLPLPGSPLPSGGSATMNLNISDCGAGLVPGMQVPFRLILLDNGVDLDWCCHVDTLWVTIPDCPVVGDGCDCEDLPNDIAQGFVVTGSMCTKTFTPVALGPCDSVRWHIDGAVVGTTSGNTPFSYSFTNGTHFVCMIVARHMADGTICEMEYCESFSILCPITIPNDGSVPLLDNKASLMLQLYPNPTVNVIHLQIQNKDDLRVAQVEILDVNGKSMRAQVGNVQAKTTNEMSMDVSSLPTGTYLLRVICEDGTSVVEKFMKI